MGEHDDIGSGWHLDKRVPLAIIMTIFIQTAGIVWWAANLENRVVTLEKANTEIATDLAARAIVTGRQDQSIVRLETQFLNVVDALQDMNAKLDRLIERGQMPASR
jgi:hypothetical protein